MIIRHGVQDPCRPLPILMNKNRVQRTKPTNLRMIEAVNTGHHPATTEIQVNGSLLAMDIRQPTNSGFRIYDLELV